MLPELSISATSRAFVDEALGVPHPRTTQIMTNFEEKLRSAWPPASWRDVTILVAVSGGADSVALLRGIEAVSATGPGKIVAAHLNHCLRGDESDADAEFVDELCKSLDLRCELGTTSSVLSDSTGDGVEANARRARYEFLQQAANAVGARYIVTAHTMDDQAETILHRIVRGTGVAGLAGIPSARQMTPAITLLRPMLNISRSEVEVYLTSIGQPYRTDSSNADPRFTRNRIRHELMPLLVSQFNERVREAIVRLGSLASETHTIVSAIVEVHFERLVETDEWNRASVQVDDQLEPAIVRELLKSVWRKMNWPEQAMTFEHWGTLAEMFRSTAPQPLTLPSKIRAEKKGGQLLLTRP